MLLAELLFMPGVRTPLHPFEEQFAWRKGPLILSQTFQQQCPSALVHIAACTPRSEA